jgi:hypothetical protein
LKPTYLSRKEQKNKRQRIWELVSDGKFAPNQIAEIVGTSVEYVWKETSKLRKAKADGGPVVSSSIIEQSKRTDEMSLIIHGQEESNRNMAKLNSVIPIKIDNGHSRINNSNQYLDIPPISSEELKIMYSEFIAGKTPIEIISLHGYHPDIVEGEYHRFLRLRDRDVDALLKSIVKDCGTELRGELKLLVERYGTIGYLTNEEIRKLLELKFQLEYRTKLQLLTLDAEEALPEGIVRLICKICKDPFPDVIVDANSDFGKKVIEHYSNIRCGLCRSKDLT